MKLISLSIILNIIFIFMFTVVGIYKRHAIISHVEKVYNVINQKSVTEKVLLTFNNEPYKASNGTVQKNSEGGGELSILFLGNSLTICGVPEEESDRENERGLTSTTIEKDYVHLLLNKIVETKQMNIEYSIINIADFERSFSSYPFEYSQLENATVKNPDYVIVQIGENVSSFDIENNGDLFEERYSELLNVFSNSVKIVCLPFWPDKNKINHITNVAVKNKAYLVDLSHLGSGIDKENFAQSYRKYKQPGVGMHPGDYGMQNIADNLFTVFNAAMK